MVVARGKTRNVVLGEIVFVPKGRKKLGFPFAILIRLTRGRAPRANSDQSCPTKVSRTFFFLSFEELSLGLRRWTIRRLVLPFSLKRRK